MINKTGADMTRTVAIIGTGHFAAYLVSGFGNVAVPPNLRLFSRTRAKADKVAASYSRAEVCGTAQQAIDGACVVIVATRPADVDVALAGLVFVHDQVVISVAAGVTLEHLQRLIGDALAVRALPIACAAINQSPVLMIPENPAARATLGQLGQVHILQNEEQFTVGTALVGAFYAMMFPLMQHLSAWASTRGLSNEMARSLVVETVNGASRMAEHDSRKSFQDIWISLAVPGGISERGMDEVRRLGGLTAWSDALDAVVHKLAGGVETSSKQPSVGGAP